MTAKRTDITEVIDELVERFPRAFFADPSQMKPLAVGVKEKILQQMSTLAPKTVADALRRYAGSSDYLKATVEGAARMDLDGQAAGVVTKGQAEHAQRRLAGMAARRSSQPDKAPKALPLPAARPQGAHKPAPPAHKPAPPAQSAFAASKPTGQQSASGRLGLADLRRAAAARRERAGSRA
jgi:ProP effector